jgi:Glycosyltransferase
MNTDKRHIIFLARWFPNKYDSMFGLFVQRHAEAAAQYDKISVIYTHADEKTQNHFDVERKEINGVDTILIYYKANQNKIISLWRFWKANRIGLRLAGKADLIHVHVLTRLGIVALIEKIIHCTPYMITEHWSRYLPGNDFNGLLRKMMTRLAVKNAAMVTTVTQNLSKAMQHHGLKNKNYVVLPNVVDVNLFQPSEHDNDVPIIIHISCFEDKSKNISGLLKAFSILKQNKIPFRATLIGEGIDFEAMIKLSDALKLENHVRFTGLLEGLSLINELSAGDFLVLSSNYENMPVVILEALSCGLPVVSTNVGGIAEIINESNGILVPAHDSEALAAAMKAMCETYQQYDSMLLRQKIVEKYSYENVGKLLNSWYNQILKQG